MLRKNHVLSELEGAINRGDQIRDRIKSVSALLDSGRKAADKFYRVFRTVIEPGLTKAHTRMYNRGARDHAGYVKVLEESLQQLAEELASAPPPPE